MTMTSRDHTQYAGTSSLDYAVRELIHDWAEDGVERFRNSRVRAALSDHAETPTPQHIRVIMAGVEQDGLVAVCDRKRSSPTQYRITVDTEPEIPERFVRDQCKALTKRSEQCRHHTAPGFDLCHHHLRRHDDVELIDEDADQSEEESDA